MQIVHISANMDSRQQQQPQHEGSYAVQSWGSVYYFCGEGNLYCTCSMRWNAAGWAKACILWSFVLTSALGFQKLCIQVALDGLLAGVVFLSPSIPSADYRAVKASLTSRSVLTSALGFRKPCIQVALDGLLAVCACSVLVGVTRSQKLHRLAASLLCQVLRRSRRRTQPDTARDAQVRRW